MEERGTTCVPSRLPFVRCWYFSSDIQTIVFKVLLKLKGKFYWFCEKNVFIKWQFSSRSSNPQFNQAGDVRSSVRFNNNTGFFQNPQHPSTCSLNHHHYPSHHNQYPTATHYPQYYGASYPGRLQKSYSFAFQTPQMMNEFYNNQHSCQNQTNQFSNYPNERPYTR